MELSFQSGRQMDEIKTTICNGEYRDLFQVVLHNILYRILLTLSIKALVNTPKSTSNNLNTKMQQYKYMQLSFKSGRLMDEIKTMICIGKYSDLFQVVLHKILYRILLTLSIKALVNTP